jgi:hypothetical protein
MFSGFASIAEAQAKAAAQRLFVTHDGLRFLAPDDSTDRPYAMFLDSAGLSTTYASSAAVNDIEPRTYSWLATVNQPASGSSYSVSVAVFFNRDTSTSTNQRDPEHPGERLVKAKFLGGGVGGGEVKLHVPVSAPSSQSTTLDIKPGHWLLICGYRLFCWYRVVAAAETVQEQVDGVDSYARTVTLAGPDWPVDRPDHDFVNVWAGLFTDLVDVHTEVIDLK